MTGIGTRNWGLGVTYQDIVDTSKALRRIRTSLTKPYRVSRSKEVKVSTHRLHIALRQRHDKLKIMINNTHMFYNKQMFFYLNNCFYIRVN